MMKIAIASGKGGTGKTFLATNLATWLSKQYAAVLVDLDVEEPNSRLFLTGDTVASIEQFRMVPEWDASACSLCGDCVENCRYHAVVRIQKRIMIFPQLCHSCYACSETCPESALPMKAHRIGLLLEINAGGLRFVEAKLDVGEEQAVPLIAKAKAYASKMKDVDIILFDCPPGTACPAVEAVKDADFVLLAAEPTRYGFHDLKLMVTLLENLAKPMALVINKFGLGDEDIEGFAREHHIPILARIPHRRDYAAAYAKGELIIDHFSELRQEMEKITEFLIGIGTVNR